MSKIRGQVRLFIIIGITVVAVFLAYLYYGKPTVNHVMLTKDKTVLKDEEDNNEKAPNTSHLKTPANEVDAERKDKVNDVVMEEGKVQSVIKKGAKGRKTFSAIVKPSETNHLDLYTEPNSNFLEFFSGKQRLVHLDLKGAAPKINYLQKMFPLFRRLGATGLLIEYEDMFPYRDHLESLSSKAAYNQSDIATILSMAENNGLSVIPLVQTFGHMEFVLKGQRYRSLRDNDNTPQVISPTNHSRMLIQAMLKQVKDLHPHIKYFHIGCDEVYKLGTSGKGKVLMTENHWTKEDLFFSHVKAVAKIVHGMNLQPIMWDDMFRRLTLDILKMSGIGDIVQPMVWQYVQQPQTRLPKDLWRKYGQVFNSVWIGSSFKGATGSSQFITDASYHLENHLNWVEIMKYYGKESKAQKEIRFEGVALTGWQRYDHFATLCELFPTAIPSLAVCLQTLKHGYFDKHLHSEVSRKILNCKGPVFLSLTRDILERDENCKFPGSRVYYDIRQLYYTIEHKINGPRLYNQKSGWLSMYNINRNFSSPGVLRRFLEYIDACEEDLKKIKERVRIDLLEIYDQYTVQEFIEVQIDSVLEKLVKDGTLAKSLEGRRTWPRRPLIGSEQDDAKNSLNINSKGSIKPTERPVSLKHLDDKSEKNNKAEPNVNGFIQNGKLQETPVLPQKVQIRTGGIGGSAG